MRGREFTGLLFLSGFSVSSILISYYVSKSELGFVCLWCMRLYAVNVGICLFCACWRVSKSATSSLSLNIGDVVCRISAVGISGQRVYRIPYWESCGNRLRPKYLFRKGKTPEEVKPRFLYDGPSIVIFAITTEDEITLAISDDPWKGNPNTSIAIVELQECHQRSPSL